MTPKEAKAYLMQYRESIECSNKLTEHLDELKAEAIRLKDHEGRSVKLDAAVARYVDACNDAASYLGMLEDRRKEIETIIGAVKNERLQMLLTEVYINGKKIVRVAADRDKSYEHICRLHGAALLAVCDVMRKEYE